MEKSFNTEGLLDKSQAENQNSQQKYSVNVNCKLQHSISNKDFLTNKICTSKYDFINALPKILCEQFSKIGNIYFLFLAILQMIPTISQSGGNPFMLIPLIFVVLVNGVKDFCEDYKRKQSDNRENKTKTVIFRNHESSKIINWEEVKPGDILKIYKDEYFPADICLLYSTNKNGLAYVETKNLDGETNLKYKESVKNTYKALKNFETEYDREQVLKRTLGRIECEMPNANMYEFEGVYHFENRTSFLNIDRHEIKNETSNRVSNALIQNSEMDNEYYSPDRRRSTGGEEEKEKTHIIQNETFNNINLDYNNFLLRGSSLRNTDYIYGIVIYCGHNTKIMLNSLNARSKQSRLFKIMNSQLKLIIIIQLIICLSFGFLYSVDPDPYLGIFYTLNITYLDSLKSFVFAFLAWLLTISNIVPISLLVTIEMIKFCQAIFISWDYKMYDKENRRTAIVQSSALNEELGQVHDIFTDKTGTLTKNVMQFRYMVIGDHLYGSESPLDQEDLVKRNIKISNVDFNDPSLFQHWADSSHKNSSNIK
jgi:phospholipid-transporting ATPase